MARQRQQGKSRKRNQSIQADMEEISGSPVHDGQSALVNALHATQQQTVPILPSQPATNVTFTPSDASIFHSSATGHAINTRVAARASQAYDAARRGTTSTQPTNSSPWDDDELDTEVVDATDTPGRPTFVLPAISDDRLPAVLDSSSTRQVAVRENEAPQAVFIRGANRLPVPHFAVAPRRSGPRPFVTQFLVAMVTVMTLFAVMTLVTPLGKGVTLSSTFQAYANAVPWIPTPTPTPSPTPVPQFYGQARGVNPGQQVVMDTIKAVFGSYATGALNIARCESGYDPNAYNGYPIGGSHAEGVFQILYPSTWSGTSYAQYSPYDYNANIRAAYEIFHNDGNSWREWACQP